MTLDELLLAKTISSDQELLLSNDAVRKLFWKYKGLLKEREINNAFWESTNENLKIAYEKLDKQESELEKAYTIIQEDLSIAQQIQASLLPTMHDSMKNDIDLAVYHKQLNEVGGDYYDFFQMRENQYAIGVFDICGHGVSAALIMAYLKAQFMQSIQHVISPKDVVNTVNNLSLGFLKEVKKYATVNFILFMKNRIKYVCAGGNGFLLHNNQTFTFLKNYNLLGLRKRSFDEFELAFEKDDILVLYTDGIIEAKDENEKDYTVKRLNNLIMNNRDKGVDEILLSCIRDYETYRQADQDDITLIILRKKG